MARAFGATCCELQCESLASISPTDLNRGAGIGALIGHRSMHHRAASFFILSDDIAHVHLQESNYWSASIDGESLLQNKVIV